MFQPVKSEPITLENVDQDPAVMTHEQLGQILKVAPMLEDMLEGVKKEAQRRLEAGQSIPGYKLVHGRGTRSWTLPEEEMADKLVRMGIPRSSVYETKLISPAKAERVTWDKKGDTCKLSDRQIKRMQEEYVATQPGKLTIALESDTRPAVTMNAAELFAPVIPQPVIEAAAVAVDTLPSWLM